MQGSREAARVFHGNITPDWDFILFLQFNMSPICIPTDELLAAQGLCVWMLLHRWAGNDISQPVQGGIFNYYLSSVTVTIAQGMGSAVLHASMHEHTARTYLQANCYSLRPHPQPALTPSWE